MTIFNRYLRLFKNRNFLLLILIIFIGQLASAFLVLSLISSVYEQTQSNFGVSGVILSFAIPGFLLMAFAGLAADIMDRKKIIMFAYIGLSLVVALILVSKQAVYASIPLSFVYFALNTFFIPASSASSAQLVKKRDLLLANSLFVFTLAGGIISGLFLAAVLHFFFGNNLTLIVCEAFLITSVILCFFLPKLSPHGNKKVDLATTLKGIFSAFVYIFNQRKMWFFFLGFAFVQGIIVFGITLAPGFFQTVVGLNIEKSPIFIFPLIGVGVLMGMFFIHRPYKNESYLVSLGIGLIGFSGLVLSLILFANIINSFFILLIPVGIFLVMIGFGTVVSLIAARTALQKNVSHSFQGTVFGANIIFSSLFSALTSPAAATLHAFFGYLNLLMFAGIVLLIVSFAAWNISKQWNF